jgi:hypothetical protein
MIHPATTRRRFAASLGVLLTLAIVVISACSGRTFSRKYEYEEDLYLALDGSATLYVNASVAALVALRGVDLNPDPKARLDRNTVRALFDSPVARVASVTTSRRDNRRYVHLRLEVPDVRRLSDAPAFAWSKYSFVQNGDVFEFRQMVSSAAGRDVGNVGWTGDELVAFRLHLPSVVPFHNSPSRTIERGNIIVWTQPLHERRKGQPVPIEVDLATETILVQTLILFGSMVVLAAATFGLVIWWVRRRGRSSPEVSKA